MLNKKTEIMKNETLKNVVLIIVILVLAFITYKMVFESKEEKTPTQEALIVLPDTSGTKIVQPTTPAAPIFDPCAQITALTEALNQAKKELIEAENKVETAQIDLQTAIKKCQIQNGIEEPVAKKTSTKTAPTTTKTAPKATSSSKATVVAPQEVISYQQKAASPTVTTGIISGNARKTVFCVNIRDMDPASYWPQIAIDAGDQIEGAVFNQNKDGHNIETYTVNTPTGLYGATDDGRIFVKAELLDKYAPTLIKMSGGPKGWTNWRTARLVGEYYIAE